MSDADGARLGSGQMFDEIADRYDLLNRIISLGIDQGWRKKTVASLELQPGYKVLDEATGTGDLAIMIGRLHPEVTITGLDPSTKMLAVGRAKVAADAAVSERVELVEGDAQALPFADDSFDGLTIAFGIRNVPDRSLALREMARVVRPGGRVAILELSEPQSGIMGPMARFHIRQVVPRLGALLSGSQEYRYLQQSIADFPSPADFSQQMRDAGLRVISTHLLTFGVCALYVAEPAGGAG